MAEGNDKGSESKEGPVTANNVVSTYASYQDFAFSAARALGKFEEAGLEGLEAAEKGFATGFVGLNAAVGFATDGVYGGLKEVGVSAAAVATNGAVVEAVDRGLVSIGIGTVDGAEGGSVLGPGGAMTGV